MASAVLLEVKGLKAKVAATGQEILKGVDLVVREGEVRVISLYCVFAEVQGGYLVLHLSRPAGLAGAGTCAPWLLRNCVSYQVH